VQVVVYQNKSYNERKLFVQVRPKRKP